MARNVFELSFRNTSAVIANLQRFNEDAKGEIRTLVRQYGEETRALVMALAPVRTGFMRDHVLARYGPEGFGWEVGWDAGDFIGAGFAFYPWFQEFGTRYMRAQPSLTPAYNTMAPQFQEELRSLLARLVAERNGGMRP